MDETKRGTFTSSKRLLDRSHWAMQMQGEARCESTVLVMDIDQYNWVKRRNGEEKGEKKKETPKKGEKKTWLKNGWHEKLHDDSHKYHHNGNNNTAHFILGTWYIFYA